MKTRGALVPLRRFALLLLLLAAARGEAQFALDWFTFDGGGGASAGGTYTLHGTIGQPDAAASSGGNYEVQGGFWPAFTAPFTNPPALRIARDGANVLLAWPEPSPGFQLQKSSSLTAPDWTDVVAPPAVVGGEKQVAQPLAPGARFYRLRRP